MNKIIIGILLYAILPKLSIAQKNDEVFRLLPNWQAVLDKAKEENKNIFVDLYATWCAPCKAMDAEVYTDPTVQRYLTENFLSIKVQLDKTKNDLPIIQSWYDSAAEISKTYHINSFPSFLFLSPNGELLKMDSGFKEATLFLQVLKMANNQDEAYYVQLKKYNEGSFPTKKLLGLAIKTKQYHNDSLANQMLMKYKQEWFDRQALGQQLDKDFGELIINFPKTISESDKIVNYIYRNPNILDSIFRPGVSADYIRYFVSRDVIDPIINEAERSQKEPDWKGIENKISEKYDPKISQSITFDNKLAWYYKQKDWENVVKFEIEKIEKKGLSSAIKTSTLGINNLVFDVIFKKSNKTEYLLKGAEYMEALLKINPDRYGWIDTYANVLYKLGRKKEAIELEKKALMMAKVKNNKSDEKEFQNTLKLMIADQPTW